MDNIQIKESNLNEGSGLKNQVDDLKAWMIGILVVLAILVVTLVLQYFAATQATFEDLKDQVVTQNAKIDLLTQQLEAGKRIK